MAVYATPLRSGRYNIFRYYTIKPTMFLWLFVFGGCTPNLEMPENNC